MSETIRVRPWADPVIDTLGHDPRSLYVETYWLPTLGPSTLLLLRRLAARFDEHPGASEVPVAEMSRSLGLGTREGRTSPLWRSFHRLVQFDLAREEGDDTLAVRRSVPPVNRRHVRRLPESLQHTHDEWVSRRLDEPAVEVARRNARRVAYTLIELGEDLDHVERTLFAAGFHPALCRECAGWAWQRHRQARVAALGDEPAATGNVA